MNNNNQTLKDLIKLYEDQITELTVLSKIELGDDVIEETNRLKSQLFNGGETTMNNNPDTTIDKKELETLMIMYLDGIEFYGTDPEWIEAKNVLDDFMRYVNELYKTYSPSSHGGETMTAGENTNNTTNNNPGTTSTHLKIYKHEGKGHWIGSTVIVVSNDRETAELMIRENLDRGGLHGEELNVVEILIEPNTLIHYDNGDY